MFTKPDLDNHECLKAIKILESKRTHILDFVLIFSSNCVKLAFAANPVLSFSLLFEFV